MDDLTPVPSEPVLPEPALPEPAPFDLAAPEPAPTRRRRGLRIAVGVLAAVVLVGVPAGIAVYTRLAAGAPDVVDRMVPSDADVYATVLLDPSLSQKLNLKGLVGNVPSLGSTSALQDRVDQGMDLLLRPEGLSFANDVRPWLGTQVALAMKLTDGTPTTVLIASTDDGRAQATLARIRGTIEGKADSWTTLQHGGVTVSVGTPASGGDGTPLAYAYVDHTAIVGDSAAMIEEVVDTDQGRHAALRTSTAYTNTLKRLPADHLGIVYASGPGITSALRGALNGSGAGDAATLHLFDQNAAAFKSLGVAISAQSKGIAADVALVTDPSQLPPAERSAVQSATGATAANPALAWIPGDADGFLTLGGLDLQSIAGSATQSATNAGVNLGGTLHGLGLTGPNGLLAHLTGDLALEVRPSSTSSVPGGALLLGSSNDAAISDFLSGIARGFAAVAPPHSQAYGTATITSIAIPGLDGLGITPAYTVTDGMAVIGTSPAQIEAVLDAHTSGAGVTAQPAFTAAGSYSASQPILFLDVDRIRAAVEKAIPSSDQAQYRKDVQPDLSRVHSLRITSQGTGGQVTGRIFVDIG